MIIWLLIILQAVFIRVGWWVYHSYFAQPKYNHPAIFWNPFARLLLIYGPSIGIIGLLIAAFILTDHPWLFLLFTVIWWIFNSRQGNISSGAHVMPVLGEDGVKLETFTTGELLDDIRSWKEETALHNINNNEEK